MIDTQTLLQPFQLNDLSLSNRIAMAPMTRARAGVSRIPNDIMRDYYTQRASAGLIITEATTISSQANGWRESPGIYTDDMEAGWKSIVDSVHNTNGKIFLQLWHCGRASHPSFHNGQRHVAPSAIAIKADYIHTPNGKEPHQIPRALDTDEIPQIVEDYRLAAIRAKRAGFDGVEIHSANGYLLDTFLQSKTNHRTDRYGGSIENRYRFLNEVIEAVVTVWPSNRIGVRLSPNGSFNDMGSPDYREQFGYVASRLNQLDLCYLHIMDGLAFGFHELGDPMTLKDFRNLFTGPLMGNCGYDQSTAQLAIESDDAEMIAIGRPFFSNPDLIERYKNQWPLNPDAQIADWYSPTGAKGYTDFTSYQTTN
jgi:N-ethylmaleimide reductase